MNVHEQVIVYWDMLLLINCIMDCLLLVMTAQVLRLPINFKRIVAAAAAGAAGSLVFLFLSLGMLVGWFYKLLLAGAMVYIAFQPKSKKIFFKAWGGLYLAAWAVGGIIFSITGTLPLGWSSGHKAAVMVLATFIASGLLLFWRNERKHGQYKTEMRVLMPAGEINITGLIDSGNRLLDPLTRDPVIVLEYDSIAHFLPWSWDGGQINCEQQFPVPAPRYIPYQAVGMPKGVLVGFRPPAVHVKKNGNWVSCSGALIGVTRQQLDPSGEYKALIPDAWSGG